MADNDIDAVYGLHSMGYHDACGPECIKRGGLPNDLIDTSGYLAPRSDWPDVDDSDGFESYWQSASRWEQEEAAQFEREEAEHFENIEAELSHWDAVQEELLCGKSKRVRNLRHLM